MRGVANRTRQCNYFAIGVNLLVAASCTPAPPPAEIMLHGLDGTVVTASALLETKPIIFFTCGCTPCEKVARKLESVSKSMVCISDLDEPALSAFVDKVGWHGRSFVDPGAKFMLKHRVLDCPKLARSGPVGISEISVSQALPPARSPR